MDPGSKELQNAIFARADASNLEADAKQYLERMIKSDLDANRGLLDVLTTDSAADPTKTGRVFGRRIGNEVEHGSIAKLIDQFFENHAEEFEALAKTKTAN